MIFTSFEPVARTEANRRVTDHQIEQLKKALNNLDLWEIRSDDARSLHLYMQEGGDENTAGAVRIPERRGDE